MGTLAGHVIRSVFFIIYGSWWCCNSIWLHLKADKRPRNDLRASSSEGENRHSRTTRFYQATQATKLSRMSWIPAPFLPRVPLEPVLKVVFSSLGIFVEEFLNYDEHNNMVMFVYHVRKPDGTLNGLSKFHHIIINFGFALSGVVDLYSLCLHIPSPTSIIFLSLSFFVEGMLLYYHTTSLAPFIAMVHLLLIFCVLSCFVFTLLRLYSPSNIIINLGLGSSLLLQGTWLIQIGYLAFGGYLGKKEEVTAEHINMAAAFFAWHLFILSISILALLTLLTVVVNNSKECTWRELFKGQRCCNRKKNRSEEYSKQFATEKLDGTNGDMEMAALSELIS